MHLSLEVIPLFALSSSPCAHLNSSASVFYHSSVTFFVFIRNCLAPDVQKRCAILNHINAIPQTNKSAHNTLCAIIKFIWMWIVIFANSWASVNIYIHLRKTNRKSLKAVVIRIVCVPCMRACMHILPAVCVLWTFIVISTCFKMKLHMHKCTVYSKQQKETTRSSWFAFFRLRWKIVETTKEN